MATAETKIQWTDRTWNPVRGCARVSSGCQRCYAERVAHRFSGKGQPYEGLTVLGKQGPRWSGEARFIPSVLNEPLSWKKPQRVFVNSMSDLAHSDVTNEQIAAIFGVMAACPQHTFQVLTKRPERLVEWFRLVGGRPGFSNPLQTCCMAALDYERETHPESDSGPLHTKRCADPEGPWPLPNVHVGVSVENQAAANERLPLLLQLPAAVRFVSAEPLLGHVDLSPWLQTGALHWVIAGGESGPGARPCNVEWITSIVDQCKAADVACFVKQLGAKPREADSLYNGNERRVLSLKDRKGGDMNEWPEALRVRQMPVRA